MAIRIRKINGKLIALCAAESKLKEGDIYLDDSIHHALDEKFYEDYKKMGFIKKRKIKKCIRKIKKIFYPWYYADVPQFGLPKIEIPIILSKKKKEMGGKNG